MDAEAESGDKIDLVADVSKKSDEENIEQLDSVDSINVKFDSDDNFIRSDSNSSNCSNHGSFIDEIMDVNASAEWIYETRKSNVPDRKYENGDVLTEIAAEVEEIFEHPESQSNKNILFIKKKRKRILNALLNDDIDFLKKEAASTGGLLSDDIRQKVWPKLIGVDLVETCPRPSLEDIEKHHYYRQVVLDVNRSLKRFPPSIKEAQRLAMLDQLVLLIMRVLCRHPQLHYYQGYHDICVTFLLVLGEETAYYVLEKLSITHLDVFMKQSMEHTLDMLNCMFPLIGKKCPQLSKFLLKSEVGVAYCISWLITWFGHVLNDYDTVVRLFDFFLVSDPVMPMYLTSAIVLHRKEEVLQQDCDMACVHSLLSNIPDDLPFENLLLESLELFDKYDYKKLRQESAYLNDSRPKTRRNLSLVQSIAKKIKSSVPASNFTVPFVIAAAVLVTAILYQAYKY